jgi:hypothetical protein
MYLLLRFVSQFREIRNEGCISLKLCILLANPRSQIIVAQGGEKPKQNNGCKVKIGSDKGGGGRGRSACSNHQ